MTRSMAKSPAYSVADIMPFTPLKEPCAPMSSSAMAQAMPQSDHNTKQKTHQSLCLATAPDRMEMEGSPTFPYEQFIFIRDTELLDRILCKRTII